MMKINFLKKKKNYQRENIKIDPDIYWKVIVILSLILILSSFAFAYNLFLKTNKNSDLITEENDSKNKDTEKDKIKDALEYFSERERKSIEIINSPASIVDPSI